VSPGLLLELDPADETEAAHDILASGTLDSISVGLALSDRTLRLRVISMISRMPAVELENVDDADVIFVLTTNRADILEPALAARPGRIDLAVELPLPDDEGRRRLFELYSRGLTLDDDVDVLKIVADSAGAAPAYLKELLRKAAVIALDRGAGPLVTQSDLEEAAAELAEGGELADRIIGRRPGAPETGATGTPRGGPTGFPTWSGTTVVSTGSPVDPRPLG